MTAYSEKPGTYGHRSDGMLGALFGYGVLGIAALVAGYFLLTVLVLPMIQYSGALLTAVWEAPGLFGDELWINLLVDAVFGAATGFVIGCLRRGFRVRNDVLEDLIDATVGRDTVTAAQLGWMFVAGSILLGTLGGVVVGALGLFEPPQLLSGGWLQLTGSPAAALLTSIGYFGGTGGPPPQAGGFFALVVAMLLVAVCLCAAVSSLVAVLGAAFGEVLIAGTVKGGVKAFGTSLVLLATRRWAARSVNNGSADESFSEGWFLRSIRAGAVEGAMIASVLTVLAIGSARIAEAGLVSTLRATVDFGEPSVFGGRPLNAETRWVGFSGAGRYLVAKVSGSGSSLLAWRLEDGSEIRFPDGAGLVALASSGNSIAIDDRMGRFSLREMDSVQVMPLGEEAREPMAFSDDGRLIAFVDRAGDVDIWDVASRQQHASLQVTRAANEQLIQLGFQPRDPNRILAVIRSKTSASAPTDRVDLWNVAHRRVEGSKEMPVYSADGFAVLPGKAILALPDPAAIRYLSLEDDKGYEAIKLDSEQNIQTAVSFRPDGKVLAVAKGRSVQLWYVNGARRLRTLAIARCHKGDQACPEGDWATAVSFSVDGHLLAVGMSSGLIYVWRTGQG